ncbi:MAG TPA: TIGR03435 family protein [Bryobacteraceae bacterium]|nr:TIGR03435 family protein [Bryobacteraceae bacterium]
MWRSPRRIEIALPALAVVLGGIAIGVAQTVPGAEFDVASIKPNIDGGPRRYQGERSPGTFVGENVTLENLIETAYSTRPWIQNVNVPSQGFRIFGAPDWMSSDCYDVTAKWNPGPPGASRTMESLEKSQARVRLMLQNLLAQRFQLKLHHETRDLPVYDLIVAKGGSKLKQGSCVPLDPNNLPQRPTADFCGTSRLGRVGVDWTLDGKGMSMDDLAGALSFLLNSRPVIDKTGFTRAFDAHLRWTPGPGEFGAPNGITPAGEENSGSIFDILPQQLGLELKPGKGPVDVLVIDHVERPSAN